MVLSTLAEDWMSERTKSEYKRGKTMSPGFKPKTSSPNYKPISTVKFDLPAINSENEQTMNL